MLSSRLLKKTHILRCAQSPHVNVLAKYASVRRFLARLGSEILLSSLQSGFFINLLGPTVAVKTSLNRIHELS
jgi:hypothetical protein